MLFTWFLHILVRLKLKTFFGALLTDTTPHPLDLRAGVSGRTDNLSRWLCSMPRWDSIITKPSVMIRKKRLANICTHTLANNNPSYANNNQCLPGQTPLFQYKWTVCVYNFSAFCQHPKSSLVIFYGWLVKRRYFASVQVTEEMP